jgi:Mg/Co/Ni transporter MgtE
MVLLINSALPVAGQPVAGAGLATSAESAALLARLEQLHPADRAAALRELRLSEALMIFILLDPARAAEVLNELDPAQTCSMLTAGLMGSLIPVPSKRLGFDPATTAGPFETAFQDVIGLAVFLWLASLHLHWLM